jgi:hypothetical protein
LQVEPVPTFNGGDSLTVHQMDRHTSS